MMWKHLLIYLFAICVSSLMKGLLWSLAHFNQVVCFLTAEFWGFFINSRCSVCHMCDLQTFSPDLQIVFSFS